MTETTEIFALGVTLYETLTGKLPYGEIEPFQRPAFHAPRRLVKLNPHIPPWLEAMVCRALAVSPDSRYEAYSEMLFDLTHPEKVRPFHQPGAPLLERDPLLFYRLGFFLLLAFCLVLLGLLLAAK
jgi:serine/threonine protein kinase